VIISGKLKSMINRLSGRVINNVLLKGVTIILEGDGANDPILTNDYNVVSVIRQGIGIYRVQVKQITFHGVNIFLRGIPNLESVITSNANTDLHEVGFQLSGGGSNEFDIQVFAIEQGTGNRLDIVPFDIEAGDFVYMSLEVNAGDGDLPPE